MLPLLGSPYNIGQGFTVNADGSVLLTKQIPPTANHGLLSIGAGPWDGASAGHFAGKAQGTGIAVNAPPGYNGNMLDLQINGVDVMHVDSAGVIRASALGALGTVDNVVGISSQGISITNESALSGIPLQIIGYATQTGDQLQVFMGATLVASIRSDGLVKGTVNGVATKEKAGAPVDGDWTVAPPDGTIVLDSTNNKIWARVGGVWKGVAVA